MMPLATLNTGESGKVVRITGSDKTKNFLESLGFNPGTEVSVISRTASGMILGLKGCRVALDKNMARRIMV